ncbi:RidA family protein [Thioclava sp. BHET1]|nr:RidA family protein [Thioclava sp. BHET1]
MDKSPVIPPRMQNIVERAGYVPAMRAGGLLFCAGQIGRDDALNVIVEPEAQFEACWRNLEEVLAAGGCGFADVVEMTSYHVDMSRHMDLFREVKNRRFPRGTCPWTRIGVAELAHPDLLVEIKVVALIPPEPE